MISIGSVIKKLRAINNVSQKEMSERLGVSCQTISKWENRKTYPDISMLPEIADFFSCDDRRFISKKYRRFE